MRIAFSPELPGILIRSSHGIVIENNTIVVGEKTVCSWKTNPAEQRVYDNMVTDGPITTTRWMHHVIKAMTAVTIYAIVRDGFGASPWTAAMIASPFLMALLTAKEWIAPSDPLHRSYSLWLHVADFLTDFSCTMPAVILASNATRHWSYAGVLTGLSALVYLLCHEDARP